MSKLRFYTEEEKNELEKFVKAPKGTYNKAEIEKFCKKYKRNNVSVGVYICKARKKLAETSNVKTPTVKKPAVNTPVLKRNEFVIPVTNWEVRTSTEGVMLVLKF